MSERRGIYPLVIVKMIRELIIDFLKQSGILQNQIVFRLYQEGYLFLAVVFFIFTAAVLAANILGMILTIALKIAKRTKKL